MTAKGLRSLLPSYSFGRHHHHHGCPTSGTASPASSHRPQRSLSEAMMEEQVAAAEAIVAKWPDPDACSAKFTSLFHEDRAEARVFLVTVRNLQRAMLFFVYGDGTASLSASAASSSAALVRAQTLMQAAMHRLEKEFHRILAANLGRLGRLDLETVSAGRSSSRSSVSDDDYEDEVRAAGDSVAEVEREADDLRAIAETMVSAGYTKECVKIYKILRKSVVDDGLYRLGFERLIPSQVDKLDLAALELKIRSWLHASRVAVATIFSGELILLNHVFAGFDSIREAIFADIAGDAAVQLLRFPESVAKTKRSTKKMFRILDLYDAVSELLPEIKSVFSFESTAAVKDQALASLSKLAEVARATLADFEAAVSKEHSKSLPPKSLPPGGGVHPIARHAMDYIGTLADYESTLAEIFAGFPFQAPSPIPGFFSDTSYSAARPLTPTCSFSSLSSDDTIATRLAWLILALLCKLDAKAAAYRNAGLSYLFLANNLQYIMSKVKSCRLRGMLGEEWAAQHAAKARQHVAGYERVAWGKVAAAVPAGEVAPGEARERMRAFSAGLEEACAVQGAWVVADAGMREEVRAAVRGMVLPAYRSFQERWPATTEVAAAARFSPEEVGERLAELFSGSEGDSGLVSYSSYRLGSSSESD